LSRNHFIHFGIERKNLKFEVGVKKADLSLALARLTVSNSQSVLAMRTVFEQMILGRDAQIWRIR
jgi:hypothetical protein